ANNLYATVNQYWDRPALHNGLFVLADLIALRQVRIEVVLAREYRAPIDRRADGKPEPDCVLDGGAIEHRQHARQRDVHGGGLGVGRGAERGSGGREDLAARAE